MTRSPKGAHTHRESDEDDDNGSADRFAENDTSRFGSRPAVTWRPWYTVEKIGKIQTDVLQKIKKKKVFNGIQTPTPNVSDQPFIYLGQINMYASIY